MDIRVPKISNRVSKRHPDTPLAKGLVISQPFKIHIYKFMLISGSFV